MPYLSDYQAILFDIDRTLIPRSKEIFPEIINMIKQLTARGIVIGLCSGRGYAELVNKLMPLFPDNSIHVLAGGSLVISNSGSIIWQKTIDPTSIEELKELIAQTKSSAVFMKPDAQYSQGKILESIRKHPWNPIGKDLQTMSSSGVGLVYIIRPQEKITAYLTNHPKLSFKDMINRKGYQYYDITSKNVTKASAVKEWAKATGVLLSKTIGIGDSVNDLEFLQSCGYAVAMGNADEEIKIITNRIIGNVQDKGLPKYVQSILEGNPL